MRRHIIVNIGIFIIAIGATDTILVTRGIITGPAGTIIATLVQAGMAVFPLLVFILTSNYTPGPVTRKIIATYTVNVIMSLLMIVSSVLLSQDIVDLLSSRCTLNDGSKTTFTSPTQGIGIVRATDGECIGISDGNFSFDAKYQRTKNAEALIYQEDQQIANQPHVTVVVATMLASDSKSLGVGRDELQGIYVVQKEIDKDCFLRSRSTCFNLRLLIANTGNNSDYAPLVAQQIIDLKKSDNTFVGVVGLPFSVEPTIEAIKMLASQQIPMISPSASSDDLTNPVVMGSSVVGYLRRIVPPNSEQGYTAAQYANAILQTRNVAIFFDDNNSYSQTLAKSFQQNLEHINNNIMISSVKYKRGQQGSIVNALSQATQTQPELDLIYFAGYADDLDSMLSALPTLRAEQQARLRIMGGDALYELGGYSQYNFRHIYFTAFAYPDEPSTRASRLAAEYPEIFGPTPADTSISPYGFTRTDSGVILSYDAMTAFVKGCQRMLTAGKKLSPADLQLALQALEPFSGASGPIAFAPDGDPIQKTILVLCVDKQGLIHDVGALVKEQLRANTPIACR